jgi:hypothetical protein
MSNEQKREAIKAAVQAAQQNIRTGVKAGIFMREGPIFVRSVKSS